MNKEEIDKWLDNEYGVSYTRLEELLDFYFEKYCDLKQENKQLKEMFEDTKTYTKEHLYKYNKDLLETNKKLLEENKQLKEQLDKYKKIIFICNRGLDKM